jgi:very-short-patch-repair endonuclease
MLRQRLTSFARALRRRETNAERLLWMELRNRQIDGWKFKRQVPHGRYVLDFFCSDAGLVIEVDGFQHVEQRTDYDAERTAYLESEGLRVLRLGNSDVLDNMNGSLETIYLALGQSPAPSPGAARRPLPEGRGNVVPNGQGKDSK